MDSTHASSSTSTRASPSTSSADLLALSQEISRLGTIFNEQEFTQKDKAQLRKFFTVEVTQRKDILDLISTLTNDREKLDYLKEFLTEQPGVERPQKRAKTGHDDDDEIDDESLNEFWQAIKNASCDKFLQLPEDTRFLGKRSGPSSLLIRKCYNDLILVAFDTKIDKLRITGNPGIGKTFFGYYLLYLLALQNVPIVYDNFHETKPIIFEGGKASISDTNGIERYLRRLDVWYIVDGKEPKEVKAKTILICSPRKDHYWDFLKYDGVVTSRFMPTWSRKEINECRSKLYDEIVSLDLAKRLFDKWGGIPRFVLQRANDPTFQNLLDHAIAKCAGDGNDDDNDDDDNDDDDGDDKGKNKSSSSTSQRQLDRNGKEPYTETIIRFASKYVRRQVTRQYEARIRERLLEKTKAGTGNPLLGIVYEYMAHKILLNGGNFDVRPLEEYAVEDYDDPDAKVNLSKQDGAIMFTKKKTGSIVNGKYCQPIEKNFPSCDSIIAPDKIFQMTDSCKTPSH
ncbi:hypothetical protein GLOIN_2v1847979 [Rhizophagus clarus]|uniref:Crinkler effector protein N-terminal domain-containing protein n=1 Tax=Rhizophagus clarus TaxID=94130 RepID=A0A8H3M3K1_9GLOM|nr:hypothetical protein GLOIN_2v1847979 [Rhizophagus clarus]